MVVQETRRLTFDRVPYKACRDMTTAAEILKEYTKIAGTHGGEHTHWVNQAATMTLCPMGKRANARRLKLMCVTGIPVTCSKCIARCAELIMQEDRETE